MNKIIPKILDLLRSNRIKPPYFHNLDQLGLDGEEIRNILEEYYGGECFVHNIIKGDKLLYEEEYVGTTYVSYTTYEYVGKNTIKFWKHSNGNWIKQEFDKYQYLIYHENSDEVILDNRNKNE